MQIQRTESGLDRGGAAALWQQTISQIRSIFGRMVYLSSLRDQNTGRYEHHGLAQAFGEAETDGALRESHSHAFAEWLRYDMERKKSDLDTYLSSFQADRSTVLETWIRLSPYRNLLPATAGEPERRSYLADLEALLDILKAENQGAAPGLDA